MARTDSPLADLPVAVLSLHSDPLAPLGEGVNGGMNLTVRRLSEGLGERGIANDVFVRMTDPTLPEVESLGPRSRVVRLPVGIADSDRAALLALAPAFADAVAHRAAVEGARYRLVHAHYWLSGMSAENLCDRWDIPWVQSFHTLARTKEAAGLGEDSLRADIELRLVEHADRLVAMSHSEARDLVGLYSAEPHDVVVAFPGIDMDNSSPDVSRKVREDLNVGDGRVILYAGRLEPLKGTDTLLETLTCLLTNDDFGDVIALIIGGDSVSGERRRLEDLAVQRGIADRVRFLGPIDHGELVRFYSAVDLCIVPSRAESFGLVAAESLGAGTPVVAANVGGLAEIVRDGVDGYLIDGDDADIFCDRVAQLLRDKPLRERMGESGREHVRQFSWPRAVERIVSIYDGLVGELNGARL